MDTPPIYGKYNSTYNMQLRQKKLNDIGCAKISIEGFEFKCSFHLSKSLCYNVYYLVNSSIVFNVICTYG